MDRSWLCCFSGALLCKRIVLQQSGRYSSLCSPHPQESNVMKRALLFSLLICGFASAQPRDDSQPATSNVRGASYPRVHPDLRVTFRLKAADAKKVQLQPGGADNGLGKGPYDLQRGDDGVWTVT